MNYFPVLSNPLFLFLSNQNFFEALCNQPLDELYRSENAAASRSVFDFCCCCCCWRSEIFGKTIHIVRFSPVCCCWGVGLGLGMIILMADGSWNRKIVQDIQLVIFWQGISIWLMMMISLWNENTKEKKLSSVSDFPRARFSQRFG